MGFGWHSNQYRVLAIIGFALILSPFLFVTGNVLEYELGFAGVMDPLDPLLADPVRKEIFKLTSPFIFLGGPLVALALNLYPVLGLSIKRSDGAISGAVTVRTRKWNLAVVTASGMLMMALFTYLVVENLGHL